MNPTAVVLGLNPNALGLIRSLVARRVPVVALDRSPGSPDDTHVWMSSRTRLCAKRFVPRGSGYDGFRRILRELGPELGEGTPILPSGDGFLSMLSRHRRELEPFYRFLVPPPDTLDLLLKKGRFYEFCEEQGVQAPRTSRVSPGVAFDAPGRGFEFPVLIKPELRTGAWERRFAPAKALVANTRDELESRLAEVAALGVEVLVQDIIPGPDSNLHFSHGYFSRESEAVALWSGRKLRQYPARFGTSTLVETRRSAEVEEQTRALCRALGLRGYVSIEFKRDPRDGTYRVLEVTPGRSWYPHFLGTSVGFNLPYLWYRDLLGHDLPHHAPPPPQDGIAWVDEYRDFVAAFEAWRRGEITLREWAGSYLAVRSFALTNPLDPVPGAMVAVRLVLSALNRIRRKGGA